MLFFWLKMRRWCVWAHSDYIHQFEIHKTRWLKAKLIEVRQRELRPRGERENGLKSITPTRRCEKIMREREMRKHDLMLVSNFQLGFPQINISHIALKHLHTREIAIEILVRHRKSLFCPTIEGWRVRFWCDLLELIYINWALLFWCVCVRTFYFLCCCSGIELN